MGEEEEEAWEAPAPFSDFNFIVSDWFDLAAIEQKPRDFIGLYYCDDDVDAEPTGWYRAVDRNGEPLQILSEEGIVWDGERGVDEDEEEADWEFRWMRKGGEEMVEFSSYFTTLEGEGVDDEEELEDEDDEEEEEEEDEDEDDEEEEEEAGEEAEAGEPGVDLDLDDKVTRTEFETILEYLDLDPAEADGIFNAIAARITEAGDEEEKAEDEDDAGLPLRAFMSALDLEIDDADAVAAILEAAQLARDDMALEAEEGEGTGDDEADAEYDPVADAANEVAAAEAALAEAEAAERAAGEALEAEQTQLAAEAEERARAKAEAKALAEAERLAAEAQAQAEADAAAKAEAEAKAEAARVEAAAQAAAYAAAAAAAAAAKAEAEAKAEAARAEAAAQAAAAAARAAAAAKKQEADRRRHRQRRCQLSVNQALNALVCELDRTQQGEDAALAVALEDGPSACLSATQRKTIRDVFASNEEALKAKVRAFMACPPLVNAAAGQEACIERCRAAVRAAVASCADGEKWTDPDFNHTTELALRRMMYVDGAKPGFDCTATLGSGWKRLTDEEEGALTLFKSGVGAGDIVQGSIGTCFLLGAMGSVAAKDQGRRLARLFVEADLEKGIFGVRFNLDGEWCFVVVDDWLPVDGDGAWLYAKSKDPAEAWCPLLEKAYCKLFTCYEMCDGGHANEAINTMIGSVAGQFTVTTKHRKKPRVYHNLLLEAKAKGWLLSTAFCKPPKAEGEEEEGEEGEDNGKGECGEEGLPCGLFAGHCYSILDVVKATDKRGTHRLIQVRNPWASGEWTGKWSDGDKKNWTKKMRQACGFSGGEDGIFWMSVQDYVNNSNGVDYARTFGVDWKKVTQFAHFKEGDLIGAALEDHTPDDGVTDELSFKQGDKLRVTSTGNGRDSWWQGTAADAGDDVEPLFFPGLKAELEGKELCKFQIMATGSGDAESAGKDTDADAARARKTKKKSAGGIRAVVMLCQRDAKPQRRWSKHHDSGLNYKDTSYSDVVLYVADDRGNILLKRHGTSRCLWGEIYLRPGAKHVAYAYNADGKGGLFFLRLLVQVPRGGNALLMQSPGVDIAELTRILDHNP